MRNFVCKCVLKLLKLHQRLQTTTIYVTHDQTEAMTMATRLVVMKDGIIQQIGAPKEVYENPENVFVGGFIGSPAMNFFNGTLEKAYLKLVKSRSQSRRKNEGFT